MVWTHIDELTFGWHNATQWWATTRCDAIQLRHVESHVFRFRSDPQCLFTRTCAVRSAVSQPSRQPLALLLVARGCTGGTLARAAGPRGVWLAQCTLSAASWWQTPAVVQHSPTPANDSSRPAPHTAARMPRPSLRETASVDSLTHGRPNADRGQCINSSTRPRRVTFKSPATWHTNYGTRTTLIQRQWIGRIVAVQEFPVHSYARWES